MSRSFDDFRKRRADYSPRAGGKQVSPQNWREVSPTVSVETLANGWTLERLEHDVLLVLLDNETALMLLPPSQRPVVFAVRGRVLFWPLLRASCWISGAPITWERAVELSGIDVYSPSSVSFQELSATAIGPEACLDLELLSTRIKDCAVRLENLQEGLMAVKNAANTQPSAALLFRRCNSPACDVVTSVPRFQSLFSLPKRSITARLGFELEPNEKQSQRLNFSSLQRHIQRMLQLCKAKSNAVIVVIGGKGVGKSTSVRFLINTLLLNPVGAVKSVGLLDCDVGQTEMTPAEFLALSIIDRPLFGPPFSHANRQSCLRRSFVGMLSPNDDPKLYVQTIESLFSKWQAEERSCPLIVNTMGWPKGLGRMMLVDILRLLQPHVVIQLQSAQERDNYSDRMTPDVVMNDRGWISHHSSVKLNYELWEAQSTKPSSENFPGGLSPHDHRETTLLGHLAGLLLAEPGVRTPLDQATDFLGGRSLVSCLTAVAPRRVPWCQLAFHTMNADRELPASVILLAMNGCLASLCRLTPDQWEELVVPEDDPDLPRVLKRKPICEAVGIGLVRAIDPVAKELLIVTGVPLEELLTVNCVLRGGMDLPMSVRQNSQLTEAPYFEATPNSGIGCTGIRKERAHLAVRKNPH